MILAADIAKTGHTTSTMEHQRETNVGDEMEAGFIYVVVDGFT